MGGGGVLVIRCSEVHLLCGTSTIKVDQSQVFELWCFWQRVMQIIHKDSVSGGASHIVLSNLNNNNSSICSHKTLLKKKKPLCLGFRGSKRDITPNC